MIKAIVFDFSRVILHVRDQNYPGSLNARHRELKQSEGYSLFDHYELNEELLDFAKTLKDKYDLYIFTSGYMHQEPELAEKLNPIFKNSFNLEDTGKSKDDPDAYKILAGLIGLAPSEILFIDDVESNITAAKSAGLQTIQYLNNQQLFEEIGGRLPR